MTFSNFAPLQAEATELAAAGVAAEKAFTDDPLATMAHLRRFGEMMALEILDQHQQPVYGQDQFDRLRRLRDHCGVVGFPLDYFHTLRKEGNKAVHGRGTVGHREALDMLQAAHRLSRWYWREYTRSCCQACRSGSQEAWPSRPTVTWPHQKVLLSLGSTTVPLFMPSGMGAAGSYSCSPRRVP
jgi:hypothetical protein